MKWFVIDISTEIEEIGVYPQIDHLKRDSYTNRILYDQDWGLKAKESEVLFEFNISAKARYTNFLSTSFLTPNTLLCDQKALSTLQYFYPPKVFKAKVDKNDYFIIYSDSINLNKINFKKSKFAATDFTDFKHFVEINSSEKYVRVVGEFNDDMIYFHQLHLQDNLKSSIIYVDPIKHHIINENVKKLLVDNGVTGVKYIPLADFSVVRI